MRRLAGVSAAMAAMLFAVPAGAATLVTNGSNQLTGVNGLVVGGSTYNVTFQDGTCNGLFGDCTVISNFTFQSQSAAGTAAAALIAAIAGSSFDSAPGTTFGCLGGESCTMLIPYGFGSINAGFFDAAAPMNGASNNFPAIFFASSPTTFDSGASNIRVWALFSPATGVPEPASWAMMLFGFAAIGVAMRRRRRTFAGGLGKFTASGTN